MHSERSPRVLRCDHSACLICSIHSDCRRRLLVRFPFPRGKGLGVRFFGTGDHLMAHGSKITRVQGVQADKLSFAKQLRREMTPAERILWKALRRNAIEGFHFRRQQVIEGFVVDFYCDAVKLAIELDGSVHQEQWKYD